MSNSPQIKVWDPLIRFFHWSLVTAFVIAYITEDDFLTVHSWAGYLILTLLAIRIVWGFVGTRYARFSSFVYSPENIIQFMKDTLHFRAKRYLGHNPAGGAMVIILILSLLITTTTGILVLGAEDHAGPLAYLFTSGDEFWGEILEEVHEFFANLTVLLVAIHVLGVLIESWIHKENLVSAMLTGFKSSKTDSK